MRSSVNQQGLAAINEHKLLLNITSRHGPLLPPPSTPPKWSDEKPRRISFPPLRTTDNNERRLRSSSIVLKTRVEEHANNVEIEKEEEEEQVSRATLIWRAVKLPMYTTAFTPVTVAGAAAYWQTGEFSWRRYMAMLASFVIINVWVNLSNDVYDFDTGVDKNKKESVVNLFGSRSRIYILAWSLLCIGFWGLTCVAIAAKNARSLVFLASSVYCFFIYQCPPFRLGYYGVGEPLCFLAYGPLSIIGFYLLHSRASELPITGAVTWASVLVGLTTTLILFCSHFHQIDDDKAAGKMSPLVRLGTETGSHVVKWSVIGFYFVVFVLGFTKAIPFPSVVLGTMTMPMGNLVVSFVQNNHKDKSKIFMGKYFCVRWNTIFGLSLAAGFVLARMLLSSRQVSPPVM